MMNVEVKTYSKPRRIGRVVVSLLLKGRNGSLLLSRGHQTIEQNCNWVEMKVVLILTIV